MSDTFDDIRSGDEVQIISPDVACGPTTVIAGLKVYPRNEAMEHWTTSNPNVTINRHNFVKIVRD